MNSESESIMNLLHDQKILTQINYYLSQRGISTTNPSLKVDINADFDQQILELDGEDLKKLFGSFGAIETITMSPVHKNSAMVTFKDIVSAYFAQQFLDQHPVPTYQARLSVKWNISDDISLSSKSSSASNNKKRNNANGKYTCRFEIQIENDKEFQVARRLIGPKGCHMKKILDACSKGCSGPIQEVIKLRLRGRGSGFKEGPDQQESDEALHLCISSPFMDKYEIACKLCRELIGGVYEEYRTFCQKTGKPVVSLEVKLIESLNNSTVRDSKVNHERPTQGDENMRFQYYQRMPRSSYYYPPSGYYKFDPRSQQYPYYMKSNIENKDNMNYYDPNTKH